jgi:hypothetical protein
MQRPEILFTLIEDAMSAYKGISTESKFGITSLRKNGKPFLLFYAGELFILSPKCNELANAQDGITKGISLNSGPGRWKHVRRRDRAPVLMLALQAYSGLEASEGDAFTSIRSDS